MKTRIHQIVLCVAAAMSVPAAQAQVLAPQDMKPGPAAVATASTLPGERPLGVTPEPRTLPASPAPEGAVNRPVNPGVLQQVEMQAQAAANQIPVRPRKALPPPPPEIEVESGQNKAFGIALSHVNRVITPFRDPEIKTTSVATISAERGVIYVSTLLQDEIALMVYEKGDPLNAISITMVPDAISPVSVKVNVAGYVPSNDTSYSMANTDLARGWESGQPFVEVVKSTFREIALGRVPEGYGFQAIRRVPAHMPVCNIPGVEIVPQQLVTGNSLVVIVARITNRNYQPIVVDESKCESPALVGAATWPSQKLGPGQSAELYVAVRQRVEVETNQRPSLLGNGAGH